MPHQCVRCGRIYQDMAEEILKGCECGSHYFFFFKQRDILKEQTEKLNREEREEIIQDLEEVMPLIEKPVILDLESIKIIKSGKFEIDLVGLFKRKPVIYKVEDGKYFIDLASTFQLLKKKSGKNNQPV